MYHILRNGNHYPIATVVKYRIYILKHFYTTHIEEN